MQISQKIKDLRVSLKLSQARFGKKLGLSGKTVSAYENSKCIPTLRVLERISQVYDAQFLAAEQSKHNALIEKFNSIKQLVLEIEKSIK